MKNIENFWRNSISKFRSRKKLVTFRTLSLKLLTFLNFRFFEIFWKPKMLIISMVIISKIKIFEKWPTFFVIEISKSIFSKSFQCFSLNFFLNLFKNSWKVQKWRLYIPKKSYARVSEENVTVVSITTWNVLLCTERAPGFRITNSRFRGHALPWGTSRIKESKIIDPSREQVWFVYY